MSDLYSLIRRSIIERGLTSSAAREEVYQQARTAVIRELWTYEPSVGEEEIDARMAQFDRAIDQLESRLAATFAEPPESPPARPQAASPNGAVSVFEGYDQDTDYVPGYLDQRPRRSAEAPSAQPHPSRTLAVRSRGNSGGLDPLALRSAAIEAALRSSDDDLAYQGEQPAEPPVEPADSDDMAFDGEERYDEAPEAEADYAPASRAGDGDHPGAGWDESERTERRVPLAAHAEDEFPFSDDSAPAEAGPAKRRGLALPALLINLSERTRIRVLIGAILLLGVVLVVLAAVILMPLLAPSGGTPPPIATAAAPAESSGSDTASAGDVVQTFTVFDGGDPTVFESGAGNPVRFDKAAGFARISSSTSDPGVRVMVGPGLAGRIAGRPVRITVVARSSQDNGAAGLRFAYENGLAISHWQTAHLNNDFASYDLVWRIPAMHADPGTDQLLIEPGIPGDGTAADIQLIKIDVLKAEP